jgi:ketosteroid isomerase-like protein
MSEDLLRQRVLNFLEVLYAGDLDGAAERCTDDVQFFSSAPIDILPHMGAHSGKAELRSMWETIYERYSEMRYEVPILVAEGDKVAALVRAFYRKRSNQRMVQFDIAVFYTLRDGKIAQIREVIDTFNLVEQLLERDLSAVLTGKPMGES